MPSKQILTLPGSRLSGSPFRWAAVNFRCAVDQAVPHGGQAFRDAPVDGRSQASFNGHAQAHDGRERSRCRPACPAPGRRRRSGSGRRMPLRTVQGADALWGRGTCGRTGTAGQCSVLSRQWARCPPPEQRRCGTERPCALQTAPISAMG